MRQHCITTANLTLVARYGLLSFPNAPHLSLRSHPLPACLGPVTSVQTQLRKWIRSRPTQAEKKGRKNKARKRYEMRRLQLSCRAIPRCSIHLLLCGNCCPSSFIDLCSGKSRGLAEKLRSRHFISNSSKTFVQHQTSFVYTALSRTAKNPRHRFFCAFKDNCALSSWRSKSSFQIQSQACSK
jgi:hypothetical protein